MRNTPDARNYTPNHLKFSRALKQLPLLNSEVAERLGISERQFYNYKNGHTPIPYTVQYALDELVRNG